MSKDPHIQAKAYVKEVIEAQRRHGHSGRVSREQFDTAVEKVAAGFTQLAAVRR